MDRLFDASVLLSGESEFFGYEKGAFSGADKTKSGQMEAADTGTVFLDEVGELPLSVQAKLLHFLQEKEFIAVGKHQNAKSRCSNYRSSQLGFV